MYYYGDGTRGIFARSPEVFLRFEPYIEAAKEGDRIPDRILDFLNTYSDKAADVMAENAKRRRTVKVQVRIDEEGKVLYD